MMRDGASSEARAEPGAPAVDARGAPGRARRGRAAAPWRGRTRAMRPGRQASAAERFSVLYDDDCGLCKWLLAGLVCRGRGAGPRPGAVQRSEAVEMLADMAPPQRIASWHLVSPQ